MKKLSIVQLLMAYSLTVICSCLPEGRQSPVAAIPFEFDGSGLEIITTSWDSIKATKSILYGNKAAVESARRVNSPHKSGELFTLVTWSPGSQGFGGNQNRPIKMVETIKFRISVNNSLVSEYSVTNGHEFKSKNECQMRIAYILNGTAAGSGLTTGRFRILSANNQYH